MKKVIFLDLDGVLNSRIYDRERDWKEQTYIDETRLPILKRIVDETGAEIVFSSTWREHWDKDPEKLDEDGKYIVGCFGRYGLKISAKTPQISLRLGDRSSEIAFYLDMAGDIDGYVILDDEVFDWTDKMRRHLVKTSAILGRGLDEEAAEKAIAILNTPKIKYKVVGWTSYDDDSYGDFEGEDKKDYLAGRLAVVENIRENGYSFSGDVYQSPVGYVPVLNNGAAFHCSRREWAKIMAEAWVLVENGRDYMAWMSKYRTEDRPSNCRKPKYPKRYVDKSLIVSKDNDFDNSLPDGYIPY